MRELGSLEREAMEVVWGAAEPVVVHDVVAALNARRAQPLAYTTVMTVMNNLVAKEWLARHRVGRAFAYRAVEDKDSRTARAMAEALEESADRRAALVGFVGRLDAADTAVLRAALEGGGVMVEPRTTAPGTGRPHSRPLSGLRVPR